MIYLLTYSRREGRILEMRVFETKQRPKAEEARLNLDLKGDPDTTEVVILEAESEEQLRATHSRYFESASDLVRNGVEAPTARR